MLMRPLEARLMGGHPCSEAALDFDAGGLRGPPNIPFASSSASFPESLPFLARDTVQKVMEFLVLLGDECWVCPLVKVGLGRQLRSLSLTLSLSSDGGGSGGCGEGAGWGDTARGEGAGRKLWAPRLPLQASSGHGGGQARVQTRGGLLCV